MSNYHSGTNQNIFSILVRFSYILTFSIGLALGSILPKEQEIGPPALIDLSRGNEINTSLINFANE